MYGRAGAAVDSSSNDGLCRRISDCARSALSPICRVSTSNAHARHKPRVCLTRDSGGNAFRSSVAVLSALPAAVRTSFAVCFPVVFFRTAFCGGAFFTGFLLTAVGEGILFDAFLAMIKAWVAMGFVVNLC